jgi:hypothetical protein
MYIGSMCINMLFTHAFGILLVRVCLHECDFQCWMRLSHLTLKITCKQTIMYEDRLQSMRGLGAAKGKFFCDRLFSTRTRNRFFYIPISAEVQ